MNQRRALLSLSRRSLWGFLLLSLLLLTACQTGRLKHESSVQTFKPRNYTKLGNLPIHIQRVVVLPIWINESLHLPDSFRPVLSQQLGLTGAFEVIDMSVPVLRELAGVDRLASFEQIPDTLIPQIRELYAADAIMFTEITQYRPYKPVSIGVRINLVDCRNYRILWAFDEIFDAANPSVAMGAKLYSRQEYQLSYPLDKTTTILQSPARFFEYVMNTAFEVLPKRSK